MDTIDQIKQEGAKNALMDSISSLILELRERNFEGIKKDGAYNRLGNAVSDGRRILSEIEKRLKAVSEMDGVSE